MFICCSNRFILESLFGDAVTAFATLVTREKARSATSPIEEAAKQHLSKYPHEKLGLNHVTRSDEERHQAIQMFHVNHLLTCPEVRTAIFAEMKLGGIIPFPHISHESIEGCLDNAMDTPWSFKVRKRSNVLSDPY